jgi:hypothetical protein
MSYFLMIFFGGFMGLVFAGPGGSIMGAITGFAIAAFQEVTGDESYGPDCYLYESSKPTDSDVTHFSNVEPMLAWDDDFSDFTCGTSLDTSIETNPATCLPMMGSGNGGLDVGGNPYGVDLALGDSGVDSWSDSSSIFDD